MSRSTHIKELYESLRRRRRPEDIAQLIAESPEIEIDPGTAKLLKFASKGSLIQNWFGYSSMSADFAQAVGCERQLSKGRELFPDIIFAGGQGGELEDANLFIEAASPEIRMNPEHTDFLSDRLNRLARDEAGLDLSKRQYNKRFRFLSRLQRKRDRFSLELRKRSFTLVSKSRLASVIPADEFYSDPASAAFISYYTARCNLRSEFTAGKQQRPYDEIADRLFSICRAAPGKTNWWAISHVFPDIEVLAHLSDEEKGHLLGKWFSILSELARLLQQVWSVSDIDRATMIVRRGNDSTTWNNTAGAWNKARDSWFKILFSLGMEDVIEAMCPGKVLRLMAADVAAGHMQIGDTLEEDTKVWCAVPFPWEVLTGEAKCSRDFVEQVCKRYTVDPIKKGWIAPPPDRRVAKFRPTPELVHGVTVEHPGLAIFLRKAGFFSGKHLKTGIE
jgi:hypothetical protein